ncbi:MAG: AAA family ATPase [Nostoc sp. ChiSLP02]|nr:AAA family ATPase [Nostoc sp. DedSLP05]MDZ8098912.1 AAA family ATPase [Nostoc sp. DedSLP01]MDZ8185912.1 AAA family ATPase [Nostoc sp. ChiSLP02]
MKVEIFNLGVIEKAEIDFKPLTIFIGGNGTGKTWTAYTLASILGKHGFEKYLKIYIDGKTHQKYPVIDKAIEDFWKEGNVRINLINFAKEYAEKYINDVSLSSHSWMKNFLGTELGKFEKMNVRFNLAETKDKIFENIRKSALEKRISFGYKGKDFLHILKEVGEENIHFYVISESAFVEKLPKIAFKRFLVEEIFKIIHKAFYSYVYIFPTERNTFITFPFSLNKEIKKLEQIDEVEKNQKKNNIDKIISEQKLKNKSAAVQSLIETLASVYLKTSTEREEEIERTPEISVYIKLAEILEKKILQGEIDFNESGLGNEIIFQPVENIKLEMTVASSMIKELAPLVLCLRYLAEPDELLIIDEPEMNLHPAAQVEISEFLAMLVQAGLNVIITTHSPYIVDHLENLMQAAKYQDKESIKERFYLEQTEAFIPQEKVSVYVFENGTAKSILNEEGRIDWRTFGNVSDDISHIFP